MSRSFRDLVRPGLTSDFGEHFFVIPAKEGIQYSTTLFNSLLDFRLRGNDKRGSVPAFPAEPATAGV